MKYEIRIEPKYVALLDYCLDAMADGSCYLYCAKFANYVKSNEGDSVVYTFDKERACSMFSRQVKYAIEDYELENSNHQEHVFARENYLWKLNDDEAERLNMEYESRML